MDKCELFETLTDALSEYTSVGNTIWLKENERDSDTFNDMVEKYGLSVSDELIRYESEFDKLAMRLLAMSDIIRTIRDNY